MDDRDVLLAWSMRPMTALTTCGASSDTCSPMPEASREPGAARCAWEEPPDSGREILVGIESYKYPSSPLYPDPRVERIDREWEVAKDATIFHTVNSKEKCQDVVGEARPHHSHPLPSRR